MAAAVIAFCTGFATIVRVGRDAPRWQRRRLPGPIAGGWRDGAGSQGHAGLDPFPPRQPPPRCTSPRLRQRTAGSALIRSRVAWSLESNRGWPCRRRSPDGAKGGLATIKTAAVHASIKGVRQRQYGGSGSDQDATDLDACNRQRFLSVRLQRSAARAPRIGTGPGTAAAL